MNKPLVDPKQFIALGRVVRPHGIRGEVKVIPLGEWPEGFRLEGRVLLTKEDDTRWCDIEWGRWSSRGAILKFCHVGDRNTAETLRGWTLRVEEGRLPALPEGRYYDHQLIGLKVRTLGGKWIGVIERVLHFPAQTLYEIHQADKVHLVPAVEAFVKKVDLNEKVVLIEPIEGLIDGDAD